MKIMNVSKIVTLNLLVAIAYLFVSSALANENLAQVPISNNEKINVVGRFIISEDGHVTMSYPGVSLSFNAFTNRIKLEAKSSTGNGSIDVLINNQYSHTVFLSNKMNTYPIFFANAPEKTQIKLINRSETWQSVNHMAFLQLESGQLLAPPVLPKRKIMIVGDSVTCASAINRGKQCETHIQGHDPKNSYGIKLGNLLDAQVHLVCFGGRGLVRSYNENPDDLQAPAFADLAVPLASESLAANGLPNTQALWPHTNYQADAILISLGTNDFNPGIPEQDWFESTYVEFVEKLFIQYPSAQILLTEGAMLNDGAPDKPNKTTIQKYLKNVVTALDSSNVHYVPSNHYPGDKCDPHPTKEQHQQMALNLSDELRKRLGW